MTVGLRAGAKMKLGSNLWIVSIGINGGKWRDARLVLAYFFEYNTSPEKKGTTIGSAVPEGTSQATTN
jgi:hypothetical protein